MDKEKMIKKLLIRFSLFPDDEGEKKDIYDIVNKYIPEGAVVLTKEQQSDIDKGIRDTYIAGRRDGRNETASEICDFMKEEVKKLGKERVVDTFGERPLLFFEAAGILAKRVKEKYGVEAK